MEERYEGRAGEYIKLYLYIRDNYGGLRDADSPPVVYIYPEDPETNLNVVKESSVGYIEPTEELNTILDLSYNILDSGAKPGEFIYISDGPNKGYYAIKAIYESKIQIEGKFNASEINVRYQILKLKAIIEATKESTGIYFIEWLVPKEEPGGYYYDKWVYEISGARYIKTQTFFVSNALPFYNTEKEDGKYVVNRYTAKPNSRLFLDVEFYDSVSGHYVDPYEITDVFLYRKRVSKATNLPIVSSNTGRIDQGNFSLFHDDNVTFGDIRKYDTLEIVGDILAGEYSIYKVLDEHTIMIDDIFSVVSDNIEYRIWPRIRIDNDITDVAIGKKATYLDIPEDFKEGHYYDVWVYKVIENEESRWLVGDVYMHDVLYTGFGAPLDSCVVTGRLTDISGAPLKDIIIEVFSDNQSEVQGTVIMNAITTTLTDKGGYFNFKAPQGSFIWFSVPAYGIRKKIAIPYSTHVNITELLK